MQVELDDISVNCEIDGPEEGPWITFSNSLSADLTMWEPQNSFFKNKFRILRYDTRGHGGSSSSEGPYTLDMLANDVLNLWDKLEIQTSHFVGLSLGGMIAQNLALQAPNRIASVVICDSRADCPEGYRANWHQRIPEVEKFGMAPLIEPSVQRWFTEDFRKLQPELIDKIRAMIGTTSNQGYIGCANAILGLDNLNKLQNISLPTLFIVGAQDGGTPPEAAQEMHKEVKNSHYAEIDPAAHLSNLENPSAFNQILLKFLNDLS